MSTQSPDDVRYVRRVLIAVGVVALAVVLFWIGRAAWRGVLMMFAGVLLGVLFDGIARLIARGLPIGRLLALALFGVAMIGGLVGLSWWMGSAIGGQFEGVRERALVAWPRVEAWIADTAWGRRLIEELSTFSPSTELAGQVGGVVAATLGGVGTVVIALVFGIYFAISPQIYVDGLMHLVPMAKRGRVREIVGEVGRALWSWLCGRLISMTVVGVGTGLGLWIADVPMAAGLGVIAGLLSFIPNIGPLLSAIPGVLVGLSQDPTTALWALAVYVGVQAIDNYLVTPFVDLRLVDVPPAVALTSQLVLGLTAGLLGLFLATPLAVAIIVLIQTFYVQDVLRDPVPLLGERGRSRWRPWKKRRKPRGASLGGREAAAAQR